MAQVSSERQRRVCEMWDILKSWCNNHFLKEKRMRSLICQGFDFEVINRMFSLSPLHVLVNSSHHSQLGLSVVMAYRRWSLKHGSHQIGKGCIKNGSVTNFGHQGMHLKSWSMEHVVLVSCGCLFLWSCWKTFCCLSQNSTSPSSKSRCFILKVSTLLCHLRAENPSSTSPQL